MFRECKAVGVIYGFGRGTACAMRRSWHHLLDMYSRFLEYLHAVILLALGFILSLARRHYPNPFPAYMVSSLFSLIEPPPSGTSVAVTSQRLHYVTTLHPRRFVGDGPYPGFGVEIVQGVVWFWLLEQWQDLPNKLWAWKSVTIWTVGHYYYGRSIWVPSLLLFDFWEYKTNPTDFLTSRVPSIIDLQSVPSTTTHIASRLFKIFRNSGDSKMGRTCRLVCREWARECAVREPIDCNWIVEDGVVWRWVETEWRILPTKCWAWKLGAFSDEWWVERDRHQQWFLKLLQPVDSESIDRTVKYPSTLPPLSRTGTSRPPRFPIASNLPPELFKYICDAADGESWSLRLVCRYWNRQCTPHVLRQIDVKESPERIRALWKHCKDPTLVRHLAVIENVPWYDKNSKFPWIHLLSQTSTSTQSVWKGCSWAPSGEITIREPFSGGHRTMRSVHFALPRSPPGALSRGIKKLCLNGKIHFRRFEDLLHLACELPDLEVLSCGASFGSLPTELPRRRPRTNRNKLRRCWVRPSHVSGAHQESVYGMLDIALYMSVYDTTSFFSEAELIPILAVLKGMREPGSTLWYMSCYNHDTQYHSQRIDFMTSSEYNIYVQFLALHILRDGIHDHPILKIAVDCSYQSLREVPWHGWNKACEHRYWKRGWKQADVEAKFREATAPLRHARFVLGFRDRKQLKYFVESVLQEDPPSLFRDATLRYGIWDENAVEAEVEYGDGYDCYGAWHQASLNSEELTGEPRCKLSDLYS